MQQTVTTLFPGTGTPEPERQRAHIIAITSGKGGVGKTNITTNLAISLARRGKRVCIFDADTGLANINILLGLTPRHTMEEFLEGGLPIEDLLLEGPRGVRIVPGASGIAEYADLDRPRQQALLNGLRQIENQFDYLLIDTAAGIASTVIRFVLAAEQAILVISPDPTSLTDSFALARVLKRNHFEGRIHAVVNMAEGADAARKVYQRFAQAAQKYLQLDVTWFGFINADRAVVSAIRLQHPVVLSQPDSPASQCFEQLAAQLEESCSAEPQRGFSDFLRAQETEPAVDPARLTMELLRGTPAAALPVHEPDPAAMANQLVEYIQGARGTPEELAAAIRPVIDAYVTRFQAYPIEMREAMYRHLEMTELPEQEIRDQVMRLEQLFEIRHQRPLLDREEVLFRLLNLVRGSESGFADALARLQRTFERQYKPGPREALATLAERLRLEGTREDDFVDCIETLRHQFAERFERPYSVPDVELRKRLGKVFGELIEHEAARQDALAILSSEISDSALHQERLQAILDELEE
jgi:flagellar biosynthesis protein FlhG